MAMPSADDTIAEMQSAPTMDEARSGRRGLGDDKQSRGGCVSTGPTQSKPGQERRVLAGHAETTGKGKGGKGSGWGAADSRGYGKPSNAWSSSRWADNRWATSGDSWSAGSWAASAWESNTSGNWASSKSNWSQPSRTAYLETGWNGEPEVGEEGAVRAVAAALSQLALGCVRRALVVGSGEAAKGAIVIASGAVPGAECFVAPTSIEAEMTVRERLNAERSAAVSQISIINISQVQDGRVGTLDLVVVVAGLRDSPAAALAVPHVATLLRPGGRLIIAIAAGPRPNAVAKVALAYANENKDERGDTARALTEAAVTFAPPCADPAQLHASLENSGLKVHHISRHAPAEGNSNGGQTNGSDGSSPTQPPIDVLVQHLAAAWAGVQVGTAPSAEHRVLFANIAKNCLKDGIQAHNARIDEIIEAEAERLR